MSAIGDLIQEFSASYPFEVVILRQRDKTFETSKKLHDKARIRNVEGVDFFELKTRRKGNERILLKAEDFKNILPGNFFFIFEFSDGHYAPGKTELIKRSEKLVKKNVDGLETTVIEDVWDAIVVPVIDSNADMVHVNRVNRLHERYHLPTFWDKWGFVILFCILVAGVLGLVWILATPVVAGFQTRTTEALVYNATHQVAQATAGLTLPRAP